MSDAFRPTDRSVIPEREPWLAGPESITHVPAKAGNDSGLWIPGSPQERRPGMTSQRRPGMTAQRTDTSGSRNFDGVGAEMSQHNNTGTRSRAFSPFALNRETRP
jgi:hypothetical protein